MLSVAVKRCAVRSFNRECHMAYLALLCLKIHRNKMLADKSPFKKYSFHKTYSVRNFEAAVTDISKKKFQENKATNRYHGLASPTFLGESLIRTKVQTASDLIESI